MADGSHASTQICAVCTIIDADADSDRTHFAVDAASDEVRLIASEDRRVLCLKLTGSKRLGLRGTADQFNAPRFDGIYFRGESI